MWRPAGLTHSGLWKAAEDLTEANLVRIVAKAGAVRVELVEEMEATT